MINESKGCFSINQVVIATTFLSGGEDMVPVGTDYLVLG